MKRICIFLFLLANVSNAEIGRSLPSGEDNPQVLRAVYHSKAGEIHFVSSTANQPGAFLGLKSGKFCTLSRIDGPSYCDDWFVSPETAELPHGCQFQFSSEDACHFNLSSENLEKGSIFQSLSTVLKAQIHAL